MSLLSLQKYGEWYYTRYFPSTCVLREKILKKSQDAVLTDQVMVLLASLLVEEKIIESRIRDSISRGKTPYYIRQKLLQKKFRPSLIEQILKEFGDMLEDPEIYRNVIENRCKKAKSRGVSRRKISYELLSQYPHFASLIAEILGGYDDPLILEAKFLPRLVKFYPEDKIIQKCIQAGFSYQDAQRALKNIQS